MNGWIVKGCCWLSWRMGGLLDGVDLGSHVGDSLEKLTQQAADAPKIAKGDDWPTFSLSTKPATVVDGRGCCCCLLHQKWSRSVSVGHWTASQCCCCYQIWTSSGVSHSSAKSQLVSPSNLCYIQVDLHCTRLLQLSGSITASGFEMVVNSHQRQCEIGQWSTWLTSSLSKQQMMSET